MPIYVIHCLDCGFVEEVYFKSVDVTGWRCSKCGSDKREKIPQASSFRLRNGSCGGFTNSRGEVVGCDKAPGPSIDKK
jgi:predicted nucleic acid-binding Zn ribbon protein